LQGMVIRHPVFQSESSRRVHSRREHGWRGLLSLRDPAGAADRHSSRRCPAGPPVQFPLCGKFHAPVLPRSDRTTAFSEAAS
jgi:hypothetical protein